MTKTWGIFYTNKILIEPQKKYFQHGHFNDIVWKSIISFEFTAKETGICALFMLEKLHEAENV